MNAMTVRPSEQNAPYENEITCFLQDLCCEIVLLKFAESARVCCIPQYTIAMKHHNHHDHHHPNITTILIVA